MGKLVTAKDVIYALQFGGEMLLGIHADGLMTMPKWRLSKTGLPVPKGVVEEVRQSSGCIPLAPPSGAKEAYGWRAAA